MLDIGLKINKNNLYIMKFYAESFFNEKKYKHS